MPSTGQPRKACLTRGIPDPTIRKTRKERIPMRVSVAAVAAVSVFALSAATAEAQFCAGSPSFRDNPHQVGVTGSFTDGAQGVTGHFATGGESLFGGVGIGVVNYSDLDSNSVIASVFGGAELSASQ